MTELITNVIGLHLSNELSDEVKKSFFSRNLGYGSISEPCLTDVTRKFAFFEKTEIIRQINTQKMRLIDERVLGVTNCLQSFLRVFELFECLLHDSNHSSRQFQDHKC